MHVVGFIKEPATVRQILEQVGERTTVPLIAPARSPPLAMNGEQLAAPEWVFEAIPERHRSPAAAAGETLNPTQPQCRRGQVQRLVRHEDRATRRRLHRVHTYRLSPSRFLLTEATIWIVAPIIAASVSNGTPLTANQLGSHGR